MSVGKKIVDGAKSGIGSLLDKITAGDAPLSGVGTAELERELAARKALRARRGEPSPRDNRVARDAGGGAEAARRRGEAADARARKVGATRAKRRVTEARQRAAEAPSAASNEEAFRKFRDDVKSGRGPSERPSSGSGSGPGASRSGRFGGLGRNDKVTQAYGTLDLADGVAFDQVKAQYRKLMRRYHPDMHTTTPSKQKAATELSMQLTQAYNVLDQHLNKK